MVRRIYTSTRRLKEGMRIDQAIVDRSGRVLIARGAPLDDYLIESLLKMGVMGVYIREGEEDPKEPGSQEPVIPESVQKVIEKTRKSDPAKVKLSESVKQRVSEGIQYLYSNTDAENFADTTDAITRNLMKAITDNQAIAVDISALKVSDEYTFKHSVDVATMAMIVGKKHGLSDKQVYDIGISGLLHDVGKSKIPNEILNKAGKLTDGEFAVMKKHSLFGYTILKDKEDISEPIAMGVLQHHEKINGRGYPMGLPEEKIHLFAKILSVADIYDALVTERVYKKAYSQRDAVEMIMSMTGELDINVDDAGTGLGCDEKFYGKRDSLSGGLYCGVEQRGKGKGSGQQARLYFKAYGGRAEIRQSLQSGRGYELCQHHYKIVAVR